MTPNERPPGSLRILPPREDEEGPGSPEKSADSAPTERDPPSQSDGQKFFRRLYVPVVGVALAVVVALVGMLLMGQEISAEVMLFAGLLASWLLLPLLLRILTDTPWSHLPSENRKTLEAIAKVVLAILGLIGILAIRSYFVP